MPLDFRKDFVLWAFENGLKVRKHSDHYAVCRSSGKKKLVQIYPCEETGFVMVRVDKVEEKGFGKWVRNLEKNGFILVRLAWKSATFRTTHDSALDLATRFMMTEPKTTL